MKRIFCIFLLISTTGLAARQPVDPARFVSLEDSMKKIGPNIFKGDDIHKTVANDAFLAMMRRAVNMEGAFDYAFDSLDFIGRLNAPDGTFRIINWNLPKDDGTQLYYCFLLVNQDKLDLGKKFRKGHSGVKVYELVDKSDVIRNAELSTLSVDKWYGALYYKIIKTSDKKKNYYTLLAWDGNSSLTWKKVIDVLTFQKDGTPVFGEKAIFQRGKLTCKRVIFEFRAELVMLLHWDEKQDCIVFDHLAPEYEGAEGMYQVYSQSFTYDSFQWKKGKWLETINVDVKNPKTKADEGYRKPVGDQ